MTRWPRPTLLWDVFTIITTGTGLQQRTNSNAHWFSIRSQRGATRFTRNFSEGWGASKKQTSKAGGDWTLIRFPLPPDGVWAGHFSTPAVMMKRFSNCPRRWNWIQPAPGREPSWGEPT